MDEWAALEVLCVEAHGDTETLAKRREELGSYREQLRTLLEALAAAQQELQIDEHITHINDRFLLGGGMVQRWEVFGGLERVVTLAWPAAADPRPERRDAGGEYRLEVWLGLHDNGRPRIRITGAKRLQALLPVSAENFRAALLAALREPTLAGREGEAPDTDDQSAEPSAAETAPGEEPAPPHAGDPEGSVSS